MLKNLNLMTDYFYKVNLVNIFLANATKNLIVYPNLWSVWSNDIKRWKVLYQKGNINHLSI